MDSENTSFQMPVVPAYGGNYGGNGGFGFGGDSAWLLLFILLCGGGWGMGGFGMGGMMWPMMMGGMGGFGMDYLYPWLNNSQHISDGFRDQNLATAISGLQNSVTSGFGDVQLGIAGINQNLCQTGNNVVSAVTAAQNGISQQLYSNELASLNRSFAEQTANTAGFTGVQSSLCDIRYGSATNTRDIIDSQTRGTQAILDKLCSLELDNYRRENDQLRTQLNMANLAASQTAQTAELRQSGATQLNQLVSELRSCPIPSYSVYGNQPVFTCAGPTTGNGCGCNGGFVN